MVQLRSFKSFRYLIAIAILATLPKISIAENRCGKFTAELLRAYTQPAPDREILAYHGTSLEALKVAEKKGKLLPGEGDKYVSKNIYFFLNEKNLVGARMNASGSPLGVNRAGSLLGASDYAGMSAAEHAILKYLRLPFNIERSRIHARILGEGFLPRWKLADDSVVEAVRYFINLGTPVSRIEAAVNKARKQKGIVFGFHESLLQSFEVLPHLGNDEGYRIVVPQGLPIEFIKFVKPLGPIETTYMEKLK